MQTPLVPSKVSWVKRCPYFGGFRYDSGRRGNAYSCRWALQIKARSRALSCCTTSSWIVLHRVPPKIKFCYSLFTSLFTIVCLQCCELIVENYKLKNSNQSVNKLFKVNSDPKNIGITVCVCVCGVCVCGVCVCGVCACVCVCVCVCVHEKKISQKEISELKSYCSLIRNSPVPRLLPPTGYEAKPIVWLCARTSSLVCMYHTEGLGTRPIHTRCFSWGVA